MVARWAHNPKVRGSNPLPATKYGLVVQWLPRLPVTQKIAGSIPVETAILFGSVAQSVEQGTENPCVGGSIPPRGTKTIYYFLHFAGVAQLAEQLICNQQVAGSIPVTSSKT